MIPAIVRSSLRFRLLVVAIAIGVMGVGIAQLRDAPVDTLPEFTPPYVEIQTEALGLSAEEVEQLITVPMEADLLNGVEGIDVMRSESLPGLSSITLVFEDDFDLYTGRQLVQERLTQMGAAAMPNISKPPVMLQPYSSSSRVLMFSLASDKVTPIEKSVIARWTLQPRLLGVPGVANVAIWGFRDRQLQVQVDPKRLRDRNVTLKQVVETTANAQISSPLTLRRGLRARHRRVHRDAPAEARRPPRVRQAHEPEGAEQGPGRRDRRQAAARRRDERRARTTSR